MNKKEAIEILKEFKKNVISEIYDTENQVVEALHTIKPDFEYPDIDYLTVESFLHRENVII